MMHKTRTRKPAINAILLLGLLLVSLAPLSAAAGPTAADAYKVMGIKPAQVLAGTALTSKVVPGAAKQLVVIASYMTGEKSQADAINVRLAVFQTVGKKLVSVYERDFGAEQGGFVGDGNLQLVDLDRDGVQEIITSFRYFESVVIDQRIAEVLLYDEDGFRTAWRGPFEYDATRAVRDVPAERRDRYLREVDIVETLRAGGQQLHMQKKMISIAGERLGKPQLVAEVFPLRASSR